MQERGTETITKRRGAKYGQDIGGEVMGGSRRPQCDR